MDSRNTRNACRRGLLPTRLSDRAAPTLLAMSIHHARKFSKCGRGSQSHRVFRLISGLATAAILAAGFVTLTPGLALAAGVVLVNEPFTGTTTSSSEWVLPGAPAGTNVACMTASTNRDHSRRSPG
jgi:hypothetical protein